MVTLLANSISHDKDKGNEKKRFNKQVGAGGGGTPDFKWQGLLNGGKIQNPKKSLDQKLTPNKSHDKFVNLESFQKPL